MPQTTDIDIMDTIIALSKCMHKDVLHAETSALTIGQLRTLYYLKHNPLATMTDIAKEFQIELPSATSTINKLTRLGFTVRESDKTDRRIIHISLTKQGNTILTEGMKEREKRMKRTLAYLSAHDKADLLRIMKTLLSEMEKTNEK